MTTDSPSSLRRFKIRRGFALVITLSLMVLLMVLSVGLLTLSSLSIRTSSHESGLQTARANARLALMLAIGELQKELGPDQRISVPSGILASDSGKAPQISHGRLTGVWNARTERLGRVAPDYDRDQPFRRWLVSSADRDALSRTTFAEDGKLEDEIELAKGDKADVVKAGRIPVNVSSVSAGGRLAWWVSDENCKGFINPGSTLGGTTAPEVANVLASTSTPGAYGMEAVAKGFPANTPEAAKVITHGQARLALPEGKYPAGGYFHDLSPYPRSVLANVVKGSLREDLSLFTEQRTFDNMPAWPSASLGGPLGPNGKIALSDVDDYDVLSWKSLAHWSRLRNKVTMDNGRPTLTAFNGNGATTPDEQVNQRWNTGTLRPAPVLERCLLFISYGTKTDPTDPAKLVVRFNAYPVMTLWNPYNVDLMVPEYSMLWTGMPMEHEVLVNGQVKGTFDWRNGGRGNGVRPVLEKPLRLNAGEAKVLSPTRWEWFSAIKHHYAHYMDAVPFRYSQAFAGGEWGNGAAGGGGDEMQITVSGKPSDRLEIRTKVKLFENGGSAFAAGNGYQSTFDIRGNHSKAGDGAWGTFLWSSKMAWRYQADSPSPDKLSDNVSKATFGELSNAPRPFMVMDAQLKALDEEDLPNKTWSQCIPSHCFQGATNSGGKTPFLASGYKLSFESINSFQEASKYLQVTPDDPTHTYFGGSHSPLGGQSWISDMEIPMAPLTSLAQLQHLPQASIDNLYSSGFLMQNHAIGNSFASPGVASDSIKNARGWPFWVDMYMNENGGTIRGQKFPRPTFLERPDIDRSYAANNLLWDDYFFSSMSPKDGVLRTADKGDLASVVKGFYEENKPLPNERYRPYLARPATDVTRELISGSKASATAHKKAAASLLVDGGFNVNSVSVNAWKSLIASGHRKRMAVLGKTGKPTVESEGKYVVSRFTMPNGPSADGGGGADSESLRWTGYRELDEDQIQALAEAVVRQVRSRGPFRSLAEFINRRLGPESDDRTLSGALQAALDDESVSINEDYRDSEITAADLTDSSYLNRRAAMGPRYQGAPACVTQADLLGPIAPLLNARSDTFVVRGYGEATAKDGSVTARAWCEAVVQRLPDYIDAAQDLPETVVNALRSQVNRSFGRRFETISFRWLSPDEL